MVILLLTRRENLHSDAIEKSLKKRKIKILRVNMDDINSTPPLISLEQNLLRVGGKEIKFEEVQSVFVHHPRIEVSEKLGVDETDRKIMLASWSAYLSGLESLLGKSRWVNKLSVQSQSSDVFRQLTVAEEAGYQVPRTCFSNDIGYVREFADGFERVLLKSGPLRGVHLQDQRILTHIADVKSLKARDLTYSPCFFQEYIDKAFELRIHVTGNRVLTCKIESQKSRQARTDWRRYDIANTPHYPYSLGSKEEKQCLEITRRLGLEMGVIDVIVTPEGEHVFLECNSNGYWIWIEELTGLPITQAVVDLLTS